MTDLKFTSPSGETTIKVEDTGRLGTVAPKTQLHIKMTEIEKVKAEIKVLEKKLSFLEELEQTKSPVEEAFKDWMGMYPPTGPSVDDIDDIRWRAFQMGYTAAYKEKVVEEPEEEPKTLYDILRELDKPMLIDDVCSAVKKWMFQYDCDYGTCEDYLEGYIECQTVLEERLR